MWQLIRYTTLGVLWALVFMVVTAVVAPEEMTLALVDALVFAALVGGAGGAVFYCATAEDTDDED